MKPFDEKHEALPAAEREQVQLERLQALVARLRRNVRRYRELIGEARIESVEDLARLPATEPEDLLTAFPYGMFALPLREVVRLHSTIGPNGMLLVVGHTRNDLAQWGRLVARQLRSAGVTSNDVIQICFEGGVYTGATGYTLGAGHIEASVIPEDPFHVEHQISMLQNYRATVLITTPTNAREIAGLLDARGIDPQSLSLRTLLLSRPVPAETREDLRTRLFAEVRCSFGVPVVMDPGLCVECAEGRFHVNEDQFVVEARGGELLVTTLTREAMPLLRYGTRIACRIRREKCPCGRTGAILEPGEYLDGRLRVNEQPLYRSQIEAILARAGVSPAQVAIEATERKLVLRVTVTAELFSDTMRRLVNLQSSIEAEFLARLNVRAEVRYVSGRP